LTTTLRSPRRLGPVAAAMAVVALLLAGCDWKGPTPTEASVTASTGPFAIATTTVGSGNGFGGGTVYYPTDTSQGDFAAVAISPGFTEGQSAISWLGPRLATQGFVVITIDTNSPFDGPAARGDQLRAALDWLATESPVAGRVDPERAAVMGHSMGGGGALEAANDDHSLLAAIPLAGWNSNTNWSTLVTPTLVVGCEDDGIAPVSSHSLPFYNSLTTEKAYLEIANGSHSCTNSSNSTIAKYVISWLKRFLDADTRYEQFLCPPPAIGGSISDYRATCPY
jgi:alpha-beta hydrolase superfamily lysophospholipase